MADSEIFSRFLNPVVLNLQKMELELKCPTCLKLLDQPMMLPCNHIFCSHCITNLTKNGTDCPSCKLPFLHQDLRPAVHIKTFVNIYKSMNSAISANFPHQRSQDDIFDKKMPSTESPVSGSNYVKEKSQEEMIYNTAREKSSNSQLRTSLFANTNTMKPKDEGKTNELATLGSKRCMRNTEEEAFANQGEPYSPPSFGHIKDSDYDSSNQGSEHRTKRSPIMVSCQKDLKVGTEHIKELDIGESKRQKLNREFDVGDKDGISTRDFLTPNSDSDRNHKSCPDIQPLHTSSYFSSTTIVECVFCHSFRITEASGPMLHYLNGKPIVVDQASQSNVLHVHQKCIEWAPQVYFSGETVMNLEAELSRASKIKCSSCGLKGAALGCYVKSCRKSYHVPCAYDIVECRWDCENYLVLCPAHSSHKLPCDSFKTKRKNKANHSSSDSSSPSADLISSTTQQRDGLWTASPAVSRDWVFCGSALSKEEKGLLDKFACLSGAVVTNLWRPNVTHVIASTDENGACSRTLKVLMAILSGKWVLNMEWVKDCMEAGHFLAEEPYEITHDVHGCFDGPKIGRIRAMEKAPKLFTGLSFYFSGYFMPSYKGYLEDLVLAAGGSLLKKNDLMHTQESSGKEISPKAFIVYSVEPPEEDDSEDLNEVVKKRSEEAEAFVAKTGARVIGHTWLLDTIAACNLQLN